MNGAMGGVLKRRKQGRGLSNALVPAGAVPAGGLVLWVRAMGVGAKWVR